MDFIEGTFKLGAGNYFDVMSVHPYWFRGVPEGLVPRLQALKKLMAQYGLQNKPIWFTEVGWSSSRPSPYFRTVMPTVFRRAGLEPSRTTVAVVSDVDQMFPSGLHLDPAQVFPEFKQVKIISLDQIKTLDVKKYPVLMPSTDEDFPMSYISDLRDYVKRGGDPVPGIRRTALLRSTCRRQPGIRRPEAHEDIPHRLGCLVAGQSAEAGSTETGNRF